MELSPKLKHFLEMALLIVGGGGLLLIMLAWAIIMLTTWGMA